MTPTLAERREVASWLKMQAARKTQSTLDGEIIQAVSDWLAETGDTGEWHPYQMPSITETPEHIF